MEYNGEFNPWPDETSMPKLSAEVYLDGDFYLTAGEKKLLAQVEEVYDKIVVVLNIGGVIDLSWIKRDDKIGAALYGGQGGMEGGTAMAQVLCGLYCVVWSIHPVNWQIPLLQDWKIIRPRKTSMSL